MKSFVVYVVLLGLLGCKQQTKNIISLDNWKRIKIDSTNATSKYIILHGDLNGDEKSDIVAGRFWYENPGTLNSLWKRHELGIDLGIDLGDDSGVLYGEPFRFRNALVLHDLDVDGDLDVFCEGFAWLRNDGKQFTYLTNIAGSSGWIQDAQVGYFRDASQIEIVYTYKNGDDVRMLTIPDDPSQSEWIDRQIYDWEGLSKSIDVGDIDNDGDQDILFCGRDAKTIQWLRNEGNSNFQPIDLAKSPVQINHRCRLADINGDGKQDAVFGHKGRLATWYEQGIAADALWHQHTIADSSTLKFDPLSVNVADMDHDGDMDVIIGEHTPDREKLEQCRLFIFENANGRGTEWVEHLVHKGDEHHQGALPADLDNDGDLDVVSTGFIHPNIFIYENKAININL